MVDIWWEAAESSSAELLGERAILRSDTSINATYGGLYLEAQWSAEPGVVTVWAPVVGMAGTIEYEASGDGWLVWYSGMMFDGEWAQLEVWED